MIFQAVIIKAVATISKIFTRSDDDEQEIFSLPLASLGFVFFVGGFDPFYRLDLS